jgi:eukaryotic-like serine/threonine-protein kinase
MGREPNNLDDERTWQQPLPAQGGGRPHDQQTHQDAATEPPRASAPAPEATDAASTSPSGPVSLVADGPSDGGTSESGSPRTQPLTEGSSEWDALPPPLFEVGKVVFDKYRLLEKIGEGGMGEVWRVWHVTLETERALKLIKPELAHNEKGWRRFQREARLMAKINHPNAVSVYDFRRTRSVAYIEMEFIRGRSLSDVVKDHRDAPMPLEWTAKVLEQLCAVLQEAHGHLDETTGKPKPIIHRDLKPSNLMLVERKDDTGPPRLKVLDFGIAKIVEDDGSPELTGAGDILGTPAYMSPEQIRGGFDKDDGHQEIDGRSDLYSTGVVLYHLLTGAIPFRGSKMALLAAHLNNTPMAMKEANPRADVPPEVERVVLQCLEKDPARRPQTARELSERFLEAAGMSDVAPRRTAVAGKSRRAAVVAAAVVLVAGIGLAAAMVARDRGKSLPPPVPPVTPIDPVATDKKPEVAIETDVPRRPRLWVPKGYAADDPNNIVPGHPGSPVNLRRLDDDVRFYYIGEHVYIPEGYEPESLDDRVGDQGWPAALIRKGDKARFILIEGKVYQRGDPRKANPADDYPGNPILPHWVRVPSFYIQETEVTVGEIEGYARSHQDAPGLKGWKDWLKKFVDNEHPEPARYPAAVVDYGLATRYATYVGGLLPTEGEWEWAAKSKHDDWLFAWGENFADGEKEKARLNNPSNFDPTPARVKMYPEDVTKQHVYDMVGNLRELCVEAYVAYGDLKLDRYSRKKPLVDARGPVDLAAPDVKIVVRGGSYTCPQERAMAFYRYREPPANLPPDVGFRIVIECPADAEGSP